MSGVIVETKVVGDAAIRAFAQLRLVVANTTPIMRAIGVGLVGIRHDRFQRGSGPDGIAWAPLNPGYAAIKTGPGILRESGMRGGLMGSMTYLAGADSVEIGTNKVYAAIHQFGGIIRPVSADKLRFRLVGGLVAVDQVEIPARPYNDIDREDEIMILETLSDALDRATAGRR